LASRVTSYQELYREKQLQLQKKHQSNEIFEVDSARQSADHDDAIFNTSPCPPPHPTLVTSVGSLSLIEPIFLFPASPTSKRLNGRQDPPYRTINEDISLSSLSENYPLSTSSSASDLIQADLALNIEDFEEENDFVGSFY
jgi:hypothetical protein